MSLRLRDLIRQVRSCKTAAEERAVIAKESAMIRTAIREEQEQYRHRNVAKLLFMHMLGYPTHFGQLECMKLIASPHFPEKRIGYLGMMLLLSEEADVLMLATNSLKNDLNSDNRFVAGLALCAIGNLATADMSRDLAPEVDKHLKSSSPYLRKKACLAMCRCLTKCPDMVEDFTERFVTLLKDRSHGVLITVLQLMTQVLMVNQIKDEDDDEDDEEEESPARAAFLRLVPSLVKLLRNLLTAGYSPDHDVGGISDPFLQVQILTLLRLLGTGDESASEEMNDVLAQVATNTESSKNAGNAILYECVQTIMAVESEDSLRVLAVNILGRFLLNRDNNIRYVALNTLSKCVVENKANGDDEEEEPADADAESNSAAAALQRHRATVVDCLKDPDISIRQRALELIYHLVNSSNVEDLTAELLNYLVVCPREHKRDICSRVLRVADRFSPSDRWRVDTLVTMLTIAGRECDRSVRSAAIAYIGRSDKDLRAYAVHKLLKAVRDDDGSQSGLLVVGIWCVGEYGDLLLQPYTYQPPSSSGALSEVADMKEGESPVSVSFMALEPSSVVDTVEAATARHSCPAEVRETALTAFAKLSDRFQGTADAVTLDRLHKLVKRDGGSHSLELQLRSCEYDALLCAVKGVSAAKRSDGDTENILGDNGGGAVSAEVMAAAKEALARMPAVDLRVMQRKRAPDMGAGMGMESFELKENGTAPAKTVSAPKAAAASGGGGGGGDLLDLNDIFGGGAAAPAAPAAPSGAAPAAAASAPSSDVDLLSDIFSAPPAAAPAAPPPATPMAAPMGDIFGGAPAAPAPAAPMGDIFGGSPPAAAPSGGGPAANPLDVLSAPAAPSAPSGGDASAAAPVVVRALSHGGLSVEFECTKPDVWNKGTSVLTAKFSNSTGEPIYGLNFQVAVPKYVTMEMKPPTSTTVPVTGGSGTKVVTQTVKVTNNMFGKKNLMLKLKVGFTSKGTKVEHMTTCSGFPAGDF